MTGPTRNIQEEMELAAHPVYGPLLLKFKEAFRDRLRRPGEYLPEVYKTNEVLDVLEGIAGQGGVGEAILDMLAYAALQTVRDQDTEST